jgi:hypothetical protein
VPNHLRRARKMGHQALADGTGVGTVRTDGKDVGMPLSEHEQRMFAEIERQLVEDDPRFIARSRRRLAAWSPVVRTRAAMVLGALGVLGVLALTFDIVFGVAGMVLLLSATLIGAGAINERNRALQQGGPPDIR